MLIFNLPGDGGWVWLDIAILMKTETLTSTDDFGFVNTCTWTWLTSRCGIFYINIINFHHIDPTEHSVPKLYIGLK